VTPSVENISHESCGTRNQECLCWRLPVSIYQYRPVSRTSEPAVCIVVSHYLAKTSEDFKCDVAVVICRGCKLVRLL
jgi:hypothetical protein